MKIALVHDGLFCRGGGEKVLLSFLEAFPEAIIYTSMYNPHDTYPELSLAKIKTSWFNSIAKNERQYKRRFFPLLFFSMRTIDLSDYDLVLMATTHSSKYVRYSSSAKVFAYTFTPFRLAWSPESYTLFNESKGILSLALRVIVSILKIIDRHYSSKIPNFIAMTEETKDRIKQAYHPSAPIPVLNPSINVNDYYVSDNIGDYYLVVSRLERYKKVDLVIEAFNMLKIPLIIVGSGVEESHLKELASKNITFMQGLSNNELAEIYSCAKGLIFPQHEDYGLTPLESAASGRPVVAYGFGGVWDTMIPYDGANDTTCTAVFFEEQTVDSIIYAITKMDKIKFDPGFIRSHAEKYHKDEFIRRLKRIVLDNEEVY